MEEEDGKLGSAIRAQYHGDVCTKKKALVVRNFLEIPKVDELLQRDLVTASVSYAQAVKSQLEMYSSYRAQDPRADAEIKSQADTRQQLISQNLDNMHLFEQKAGKVLRFYF